MIKKELLPVLYGASQVKILHFCITEGAVCFRIHWHERVELLRIREGEIYVGADKEMQCIKGGEAILIPPGMPHHGIAGAGGVSYDVFMFDIRSFYNGTEACKVWFEAFYDGRVKLQAIIRIPEIIFCLDEMSDTEEEKLGALKRVECIYKLMYLLFEYLMISFDKDRKSSSEFQKILQYIEENYNSEITTKSLSKRFGYSEEHFCRKFKAATGLTPMKYVRILRVEKAYDMLKKGERDIGRIAEACGFHEANYLTRCFKAHFGVPPSCFLQNKL